MYHFDADYTPKINTLAAVIATCTVNELVSLHEIIRARYDMISAEVAKTLKPNDLVFFMSLKRKNYYKTTGRLTLVGPKCKLITSSGGVWTVPAYMLTKVEE